VAFSSDGSRVVSGSGERTIWTWDALTGELESVSIGHFDWVSSVAFSSDGSRVVSGSFDNTVRIWNVVSGESEGVLNGHSDHVLSVAFSRDGNHVISGSSDNTVRIWSVVTGDVLRGYSDSVSSVSLPNEETLLIWSAVTGEPGLLPIVQLPDQSVVRYRPNGKFCISTEPCDPYPCRHHFSCYVSSDGAWVQTDSVRRVCWIPQ
jgi:WD40 repeat protein